MEDLEELSSELQLKGSRLKSWTCVIKFENTLGSPFSSLLGTYSKASSVQEGDSKRFSILQHSLLNFTKSVAGYESCMYYFVTGVNGN